MNNKKRYMYCTVKLAEAVKQAAVDARESSWCRCTWLVRLVTVCFGAWGLSEATRHRETEDREGLCVSICTAVGLKSHGQCNKTSWYRLADVNGTHAYYKQ